MRKLRFACCLLLLLPAVVAAQTKPKVRAITAFVKLDPAHYQEQARAALDFLHKAKAEIERSGYEVMTIRITTQPFPQYIKGASDEDALAFFHAWDQLAQKEGFDTSIGPAMMSDSDDPRMAEILGRVLASAKTTEGSIIIGGEDGIHWQSVAAAARLIKFLAERTPHSQGNFNFTASVMVPPLTPFYPASYHLGEGKQFAIGLQSAGVVADAFTGSRSPEAARQKLTAMLGKHARIIEAAAKKVAAQTGWGYAGIDLSPAPLKEESIAGAIEKLTHARFGSSGTMTAVAAITGALKDVPVQHAGYSGLMLPVLEDSLLAQRWGEGGISIDSLLAYSAVCGTGLDTIPLPGSVSEEQLARMLGDVASLAIKWHKPLAARLLPVAGAKPGEMTSFDDPFLVNTKLWPLP